MFYCQFSIVIRSELQQFFLMRFHVIFLNLYNINHRFFYKWTLHGAASKIHVQIYPYLISEVDEIVRPCDQHCNKTLTHETLPNTKKGDNGWSNFSKNL